MSELVDRRRLLVTARDRFLDGNESQLDAVPGHVAASWRRCVSSGVQPDVVSTVYFADVDVDSRLVRCAQPVIDEVAEQIADMPMCLALTDNQVRVLIRRDSDPAFGRLVEKLYFAAGFDYAETAVGTNGVGTVLEFGTSVYIVGAEHFVDPLQPFACAGAPIRDPYSGRILGVFDISSFAEQASPLMHALARSAAAKIERNLLLDRNQSQQALFDAYCRADGHGRQAVLAVGPQLVIANPVVLGLLDPGDQEMLLEHVRFVMQRQPTLDAVVELPSGGQVRARGSTISVGSDVAGMVVVVTPIRSTEDERVATAARRPSSAGTEPAGHCPAWRAAASTVETALRTGTPVLVLGEPGSGRATLLAELFGRRHDGGRTVSLAADAVQAAPLDIAERLTRTSSRPVLHVLRDVDRLSPATVQTLVGALGRAPSNLAATATDGGPPDAPHHALLALFGASATVPPLRHRAPDMPALVESVLAALAPQRDVRLSRDALRLVRQYHWPGNVRELVDALTSALRRRPVGRIEAEDLPAYCHSTPRRALRAVDEIERDAIVAALRGAGGNRVAAAAALGLARSTLYRKIRQYGITA